MKKRILSLLLVLIMVLGMFPVSAMASGESSEDVVYLSISFDGQYIDDKNGNPIVYLPIPLETIAAVDLTAYGLENMLFDPDDPENGTNYATTALQMLIYAHEELYGGDWSDVSFDALPGSSYFSGGIFGFTENLVYFHNGDFPVDPSQESDYMTTGATSDHIVLEAGDFIDVASFSCYSFLWDQLGGFHLFADPDGNYVHDYTATAGEALTVKVKHSFCDLMYGQSWVNDATDYEVYYGASFGEAEGTVVTDENGCAEITFPSAGTYYVWCDGDNGSDDGTHTYCGGAKPCIVSAPAYAKVTVTGSSQPEPEQPNPDKAAADAVMATIDAIGNVTLDSEEAITAARTAYDALTDVQKVLVTNADTLTAAETKLAELKAAADQTAADAVKANITAIDEVTLEKENAITAARTAYNALTDTQKALVDNLSTLEAAEARLNELKAAAERAAADQAAADAVEALIAALGEVTLEKESTITAARTAYNALTEAQKVLVENYDVLTAAESALAELKANPPRQPQDISAVLNATLTQLAESVPAPSFGTNYGEWSVFSLARGNYFAKDNQYFKDYYTRILGTVELTAKAVNLNGALDENKSTDNSRVIFALSSIGVDATSVGEWDLVDAYSTNGINWISRQGLNGTIWALIALDSGNYETSDPTIRQQCVDAILDTQHNDGGWSLVTTKTQPSNVDITGMTLTALYPYRDQPKVATACAEAIAWLSESQLDNGGFPYGNGETSESCAWAIVGLTTWGINPDTDPRFIKNGYSAIDNLLSYYLEDCARFEHVRGAGYNAMATDQASYAMVAYDRFVNGEETLFDMSDVEIEASGQQFTRAESVTLDQTELSLAVGESVTLTATVGPQEATIKTVKWSSSAGSVAKVENGKVTAEAVGTAVITATTDDGGKTTTCTVTVTGGNAPVLPDKKTINVTMRLIGAELSTQDVDLSETEYLPNYVTWLPTTTYTLDEGATVYDLWIEATEDAGIDSIGANKNYVETVYSPISGYELSEFTNGARSGWMYTINGSHPGFGLCEQTLNDGDVVIWHYVNDYAWEVEDWSAIGGTSWPQLSTGANNYWSRWLMAPNIYGGKGGAIAKAAVAQKPEKEGAADENATISIPGSETPIRIEATVEGTKITVDEIDLSQLGAGSGSDTAGTVTMDFSNLESDELITAVALPTEAIKQIAEAVSDPNKETGSLEIVLSGGASIEFDAVALKEQVAQAKAPDITVSIERADSVNISKVQKDALGSRPGFDINVTSGDRHISDMGGKITVHVSYELKTGEKARGIVVWYVDDNGNKERCETAYDPVRKRVNWKTDHLSLYMIGYDEALANNPFTDVGEDTYYFDAVLWAVDEGITNGTSATAFSPNAACTRAQMVTFLWRAAGSPKATTSTCVFTDVDRDAYYYEALLWAVENGITNGTGETNFSPNATCTRSQMAAFLYRNAKSPAVNGNHSFSDVKADAYYNDAVIWAAAEGITNGTGDTSFSPNADCTRAQMVTFLYRYLAK